MDISTIFSKAAPWLAAAAAGPAGLAGMAIKTAAEALGAKDQTVDGITQAIVGATPDQLQKFKEADQQFAIRMQELGFKQIADMQALSDADRKDARALLVSTRSIVPAVLSFIVVGGFLGLLGGMMFGVLHASDSQALLLMLGTLGAAFGAVMQFWFGTTNDSGRKTEMLANSTPLPAVKK